MTIDLPPDLIHRVRRRAASGMDIRHTLILAGDVDGATAEMHAAAKEAWRAALIMAYRAETGGDPE